MIQVSAWVEEKRAFGPFFVSAIRTALVLFPIPPMFPSAGRCPAASARSIVETKKATRGVAFSGVATPESGPSAKAFHDKCENTLLSLLD
ncbi:hypothetical protein P4132_25800 [Pseudomonas aeruginosa]|nr:hypothetical protein [Pseudomonas aeruginosa]